MSRKIVYYDAYTGEQIIDPTFHDFVSDHAIIRIAPSMKLVEVAIAVDDETFRKIAEMTRDESWLGLVERPPDRIVFRSHRGVKVNVFLDYDPDAEHYEHYVLGPEDLEEVVLDPKVRIPVTPGTLSEHGYATDLSATARRKILSEIIEKHGEKAISVYRHLIARATQHRRNPQIAKKLREDADWLKQTYYRTKYWR